MMPMAGRGERFKQAGYSTPKPLIEISKGVPMFVKATNSLPLHMMTEIVFVVLREHCEKFGFDKEIQKRYAHYPIRIVILDDVTSGQAETVALSLDRSRLDDSLMIFNGDSAFEDDLSAWINSESGNWSGALQVFRDESPRWSFAKVDSAGAVIQTAEKTPISNLASTGLYYFKSWIQFLDHHGRLTPAGGEKYIAPIYNSLMADGLRVGIIPCHRYLCFGTPDDFEACRNGRVYSY